MTSLAAAASQPPTASSWHALEAQIALATLASGEEQGLSATDAGERLKRHGPNVLNHRPGASLARLLWRKINQ